MYRGLSPHKFTPVPGVHKTSSGRGIAALDFSKAVARAADLGRVCRAWHRACEVEVLTPGISGAEGKEKGKGVIVR